MGQPKTQQVGGGGNTGVANDWTQFLKSGMSTGFGGSPNGAATGVNQAAGQTNAFGHAINSMLNGMPGDPTTYSHFFNLAGSGGFSPSQGGSFGDGGAGNLLNYNTNSPEFAALQQVQQNQVQNDVANLHARFAAGGGNSLGSGASLAESQYLANARPQNLLALGDLGRQMQQLDMQNRGQNAGFNLQNQAMQNQYGLGQAQVGLGMMGQQANSQSDILSKLFGAYGQSNQIGSPQAQIVQQPSALGQFASGLGGILGTAGSLFGATNPFGAGLGLAGGLSSLFGGHGGGMPNIGGIPSIQQTSGIPQFGGGVPGMSPVSRMPIAYNPFAGMS